MFNHDAAEPTEGGGMRLLPEGDYELSIINVTEKKTSKGFPMVNVECEVINNAEFNGAKVFHNVTFMPKDQKGAGMSSHFLKCINQPYQGEITVDPLKWIGEIFLAKIGSREYTNKNNVKVTTNDIKEVKASEDAPF